MLDFVVVFVFVLLSVWWWSTRRQTGLPPSPGIALPVIGHLYLMEQDPTRLLQKWRKRLGDVFTLKLGSKTAVFINGYDVIHEALVKQHSVFMNRSDSFIHTEIMNGKGVASLAGEEWKEQRIFLLSTMRTLGMGKKFMAERINLEISFFLDALKEMKGEPMDVRRLITLCISNIVCHVTIGRRFDYEDPLLYILQEQLAASTHLLSNSSMLHFFLGAIKLLPGDLFGYKKIMALRQSMKDFFKEIIEDSRQSIDMNKNGTNTCVTEIYLEEMKRKQANNETETSFSFDNLLHTCWDFFAAGVDSVVNTLHFAVLYLVVFPDVQEKIYAEMKEIVGTEALPDVSHKPQLKYLNAFIFETQRFASLVPTSLDRTTTTDTMLNGHVIPKGCLVLTVLDSLMWDEETWGDPMTFRPERFLQNGELTVKKEFLPFSIGRRSCVGESLAVMELYLIIGALVHTFQLLPEDPNNMPTTKGVYGLTRSPHLFNARLVLRKV